MAVKKVKRLIGKEDLAEKTKELMKTGPYTHNEAVKKAKAQLKRESRK